MKEPGHRIQGGLVSLSRTPGNFPGCPPLQFGGDDCIYKMPSVPTSRFAYTCAHKLFWCYPIWVGYEVDIWEAVLTGVVGGDLFFLEECTMFF